ncbi:hypothetical protein [Candidatus Methanomassiliicoccus intestinalis]|uniref:hypothetical protein n=1 Tax=Candidatus Methanomassiliicoccus intestinalis TaxID=1406512 RepID=UPI0037DC5705
MIEQTISGDTMSTHNEGVRLREVFRKYYDGKEIDESDLETLNKLVAGSYIDYSMDNGVPIAKASQIGRAIRKPKAIALKY